MSTIGKEVKEGNHWSAIIEMDGRDFPNPWSRAEWDQLDFNHHTLFTYVTENKLQGYALFQTLPGEPVAHLLKICIDPSQRGTRMASEFWTKIRQGLSELAHQAIYLEVALNNTRAIGFYRKMGFRELRVIRGYYSNGDDALVMDVTL